MSELTKRIIIAIPLAAIVLYVTWLGEFYFKILVGAIALITVWEIHRMMRQAGRPGYFEASILIACSIWSALFLPRMVTLVLTSLILIITLISLIKRGSEYSERWLSSLFTGVYAPVGFLMIVHLRDLGNSVDGFWLTITLFLMIWGNDIFAFIGGKTFGKRPLAPVLSPKKTWEGFYWGFFGASAGYLIVYFAAVTYPLPLWAIIPSVLIISLLGPLGDITASSLKRKAGVKDSSAILPGHGGLFDRFDSMILSAPFLYFCFILLI